MAAAADGQRAALRVLRVLTRPNVGGPTRQAIALWHAHRQLGVRTLLVTGAVDADEAALLPDRHGVPRVSFEQVAARRLDADGWLELPLLARGVAPLRDLRARRLLVRLCRWFAPHVVHTHTSKAGVLGRTAARAAKVPVVAHTFHGHVLRDYFGPLASSFATWLERTLARRTSLLFAVSDSCADELAELGVAARSRFDVVPPAVALPQLHERTAARTLLGIPPHQKRLVCIGRLVPIKRVDDFVATLAQLPGYHGDIVGDGPEAAALAARAEVVARGRITLRRTVDEVVRLLPAWDALVLPSVREGCPLVAIEAFAAGVPVFGYDVPGVRDALATLGHGVLVPEVAGPLGLAAALAAWLADADAVATLTERARAAVAACAPERVATALLERYRAACAVASRSRTLPEPC